MKRYLVKIVWRYELGHRETSTYRKTVKSLDQGRAEDWAVKGLRVKFAPHGIEVVSVTSELTD